MIHYLSLGLFLGLSAGFSPGPLTTLVVSETLMHDIKAGIKVAMAPLITDLPIIVLSVFILSKLAGFQTILGGISFVGGVVLMVMGYNSLKLKKEALVMDPEKTRSLSKGIAVNFLSPHPYLFWLSVGAPLISKAENETGHASAGMFLIGFYLMLIGAKVFLAVLSGRFKTFLKGDVYIFMMRFLGLLLCLLALFLFRDGLSLIGMI